MIGECLAGCLIGKPGSVPSYPDANATTALPHAGEERADGNVEHAGPEDLHPAHVEDTELQAGHDQPGEMQREEIGNRIIIIMMVFTITVIIIVMLVVEVFIIKNFIINLKLLVTNWETNSEETLLCLKEHVFIYLDYGIYTLGFTVLQLYYSSHYGGESPK